MTFSNEVRDEVTSIKIYKESEMMSFLLAVILFSSHIEKDGKNIKKFFIKAENLSISNKIEYFFKKIFAITLEINQKNNYNFGRNQFYVLNYPEECKNISEIMNVLGIYICSCEVGALCDKNTFLDKYSENDIKIFLRAVYIMCGSVSNPKKNYHLEFVAKNSYLAKFLVDILSVNGILSHFIEKKDVFVVYIKESETISDFLNLIGAHSSMFKLEDIIIEKTMRNNVNRIVNCETANLSRISKTYLRQKNAIDYLISKDKMDLLSEDLKELALLRVENESDSLRELGEKLSKPLSKSGVNHKLRKIESIVNKLIEEEK